MIGLQREIERRKEGLQLTKNEVVSYSYISKIINKPYATTKRQITNGSLTVEDAIKIFKTIPFKCKSRGEAFEYLFTDQGE